MSKISDGPLIRVIVRSASRGGDATFFFFFFCFLSARRLATPHSRETLESCDSRRTPSGKTARGVRAANVNRTCVCACSRTTDHREGNETRVGRRSSDDYPNARAATTYRLPPDPPTSSTPRRWRGWRRTPWRRQRVDRFPPRAVAGHSVYYACVPGSCANAI